MGFIGNIVKTIFAPDVPQVQTPSITGRDLLTSTSSDEPEAPVMGSAKKKSSGMSSLLVPTEDVMRG